MALGCKYDEMIDFHTLLNAFNNTYKATTNETSDVKNRTLTYVKPFYDNYTDAYKNIMIADKQKTKRNRGVTVNALK